MEEEDEELKRFGLELFDAEVSTFAPVDDMPAPDGYYLGAGDTLNVYMYGNEEADLVLRWKDDPECEQKQGGRRSRMSFRPHQGCGRVVLLLCGEVRKLILLLKNKHSPLNWNRVAFLSLSMGRLLGPSEHRGRRLNKSNRFRSPVECHRR